MATDRHMVKASVFDIDANEFVELEFEVSDDVYKIITNGIGANYSMDGWRTVGHMSERGVDLR